MGKGSIDLLSRSIAAQVHSGSSQLRPRSWGKDTGWTIPAAPLPDAPAPCQGCASAARGKLGQPVPPHGCECAAPPAPASPGNTTAVAKEPPCIRKPPGQGPSQAGDATTGGTGGTRPCREQCGARLGTAWSSGRQGCSVCTACLAPPFPVSVCLHEMETVQAPAGCANVCVRAHAWGLELSVCVHLGPGAQCVCMYVCVTHRAWSSACV